MGTHLAAPDRRAAADQPSSSIPTGNGSRVPDRAAAASRAEGNGGPGDRATSVRLSVLSPTGRRLLTTVVDRLDPVRAGAGYAPVDPPVWNHAVWVRYRPLVPPTDTTRGTSYVYGHACHHHVCAFTALAGAARGGWIVVRSGAATVRYRITNTSADYPKSGPGSLAARTGGVANRGITHRIVLVTCAYDRGDVSLSNFVVVGTRR
jgi:hypothetical protein